MSQPTDTRTDVNEEGSVVLRHGSAGERCQACHGIRGKVIARVNVVKKYNDGFKVHEYKYLRLTHRKMLKDGTLKRTYCYWDFGRRAAKASSLQNS